MKINFDFSMVINNCSLDLFLDIVVIVILTLTFLIMIAFYLTLLFIKFLVIQ